MTRVCALFFITLAACTETVQLEPDPLGDLISLEIKPTSAQLTISDLSSKQQLVYHAIGVFSDGSRRDVTSQLTWTVDNAAPGTFFDPGIYTTSNIAAGHVLVTATADAVQVQLDLTINVDIEIIDTAFPPSDPGLFDPTYPVAVDMALSPQLLYPTGATRFPQGVSRTLFQYSVGSGNDAFRLTFDSDVLHIVVLSGTDRWDTGDVIQTLLSQSNIGMPIAVGIQAAASTNPGIVYAGRSINLEFEQDLPDGVIYFWSAATNAIMRGALGTTTAPKQYPGTATCAGCHTTSRDGAQMAMGYGGEKLQTIDLSTLATVIPVSMNIDMGWATYSPDNRFVLVANKGTLTLYDARTGLTAGTPTGKINLPLNHYGTHPDWSPDGRYVAFAYTTFAVVSNMDVKGAAIARIPFDSATTTFGPPEVLVPATATDNFYFPKYSPDGHFIAYVHATSSSHAAPSAELQLIGETGGLPIQLYTASHSVGQDPALVDPANTMPSWAPFSGGRAWLSFASSRPYGAVLPTSGRGQIWVAGIDLAHAEPNMDPSAAAFWLPCQDVTVLNNNPIWAPSPNPPQ